MTVRQTGVELSQGNGLLCEGICLGARDATHTRFSRQARDQQVYHQGLYFFEFIAYKFEAHSVFDCLLESANESLEKSGVTSYTSFS